MGKGDGKVYFRHVRNIDGEGNVGNMGGATIAYQEIAPDVFKIAVAKCHPKDNFCKKIGRVKSTGRLNSTNLSYVVNTDWASLHAQFPKNLEEFNKACE
jgi:hypothetical protein